ncbi:hypothetical protein KIPE111705_08645 [Kibdelosporangium persicum]|uniref:Uncharacterized protein n=1 Tax=Kibdelosporangium persicum TaxID=2698649 RepID=A0ABX2EXP1_9PSEU|nr:hypothetical protein [Kibdelosporangium persicum]NRN63774.1 hypothetical protein [Kibdelosporangium persicum]
MSEYELREGLRLAVADEPPMTFDLDELMLTAERMVRRRRALVAVGVSTAAVAVVAVTVPVLLGIGGSPEELPQAAPPSTTPSQTSTATSATPATPPARPKLTAAQLRQRGNELRAYLRPQFPKDVPGAQNVNVRPFGGEAEDQFWEGQDYLEGMVRFTLGEVQTAVAVYVSNEQASQPCTGCQERPQPDGSKVVIHAESGPAGNDPAMLITSATHFRNDGTATRITAYNYDPTGGSPLRYQDRVALTEEQLVKLATDPTLHL